MMTSDGLILCDMDVCVHECESVKCEGQLVVVDADLVVAVEFLYSVWRLLQMIVWLP